MIKTPITKINTRIPSSISSKNIPFKILKKYALLPQKCERFGIFFFVQVV